MQHKGCPGLENLTIAVMFSRVAPVRTSSSLTNATWGELDRVHSYDELCQRV